MVCGSRPGRRRSALAGVLVTCAVLIALLGVGTGSARAGTWTLVSCTLPDGQPAATDGWSSSYWAGGASTGSGDIDSCAAGGALTAVSSAAAAPFSYTGPEWVFSAPAGATIAGGTLTATLTAPQGQTWIGSPNPSYDGADVFADCVVSVPCGASGTAAGTFTIGHPGGTRIYAPALCVDYGSPLCPVGAPGAVNAEVDIHAADITLDTAATPAAEDVRGGLLERRVHGIAGLRFTATDPLASGGAGPGVYAVSATLDGGSVYGSSPEGGDCASLGTGATGGFVFDHARPCPARTPVRFTVDTTALSDGPHPLAVSVTDAASNTATVISTTVDTFNPVLTPAPIAGTLRTRLRIGYVFAGRHTSLDSVRARGLPAHGHVAVSCRGRGCPILFPARAPAAAPGALWSAVRAARFTAGQRLTVTITARHRPPERIVLRMRAGTRPGQRAG